MAKLLGKVTHWYDKIGVAVIKLTAGLKKGDRIKIKHGADEFEDTANSIQIDHQDVVLAGRGDDAAIKLNQRAKEGSEVYAAE